MPLSKETVIGPEKDAVRIVSANDAQEQTQTQVPEPERNKAMSAPKANGTATTPELTEQKANGSSINGVLAEVEELKSVLRDAFTRTNRLGASIKRQRKQSQIVQSTLSALRQLQSVEG